MTDITEEAKTFWAKFIAAVKSAPMTFVYGAVLGFAAGALLL